MKAEDITRREQRLLAVAEACRLLDIGRTSFYQLKKQNHLRVVKIGRRTLVSSEVIASFIEGLNG